MKWNDTDNRFVAFFDIMGFKNLVQTKSHANILKQMRQLAAIVNYIDSQEIVSKNSQSVLKSTIFSDSIILISNNNTVSSAANIMLHSSLLMTVAIRLGIPMKGCIAHGKFTADFENSIFFGQPLIDAYLLEEELSLYSIVLHNSFENHLINKYYGGYKFRDNIRWFKYLTPLKVGKSQHYHLNWIFYGFLLNEKVDNSTKIEEFRKLINNFYLTVSGRTRSYVDNTVDFFEQLVAYK
ncbi:hypothetical protein HYN48_13145 [Flavobacterium magnum]|uniref:Guanylate cyclase domain-containing protein n=1 Tax=Flavobacterium magnum TaxID=2162713 RepID=A0A2S0RH53_9FLAO|nr:hypothetical protein [Flavobacterium magnum]AWA30945.1 hypothetical protein HYN48_13145 [Flavobacterium magnum]